MNEFDFSEDIIRKTDKLILKFLLFSTPILFGLALVVLNESVSGALVESGGAFAISIAIFIIERPLNNRRLRKIKIFTDDIKLIRQSKGTQKNILWCNIDKIKVTENARGQIHSIKLRGKSKQVIRLYGLCGMDEIANLIKDRVSDSVSTQIKRHRLDWENPFIFVLVPWCYIIVTFFVFILLGKLFWDPFSTVANKYVMHPLIKFIFRLAGFDV